MKELYIAKLYLDKEEIDSHSGDDLDELYAWLLAKAEGQFGNVHGKIVDSKTHDVLKRFRKTPPD